jgi:hypothetical protein
VGIPGIRRGLLVGRAKTAADRDEQPGFPSARLTEEDKSRFLKGMMACRTLKKMRMVVEDFSLKGRGLVGTAF